MSTNSVTGLFIAEGSSDQPLAEIVESLFFERGFLVHLSAPDFSLFQDKVRRDVQSKIRAGMELSGQVVDLIVVHRDSDNLDPTVRRAEIFRASEELGLKSTIVPVVPVKMTEAWLLLDEVAIRHVAGNPRGQNDLGLPKPSEVERKADPKKVLQDCLLKAAGVSGRRRDGVAKRFTQHRKQLLERLDQSGPVSTLESWKDLVSHIDSAIAAWGDR
jgi:hypothetical protein